MVLPCLVEGTAFASLSYLDLRENRVDGKAVLRVASSISALQERGWTGIFMLSVIKWNAFCFPQKFEIRFFPTSRECVSPLDSRVSPQRIAVTLSPAEEKRVCDGLQKTFRRMTRPHLEILGRSSGWASGLLDAWSRRLEERSQRRKRSAVERCGAGGFYGSSKRMKFEAETPSSTHHPKDADGRRAVMFHRIHRVGVKGAAQVKPSKQTRPQSDAASDMDMDPDDLILDMYKK